MKDDVIANIDKTLIAFYSSRKHKHWVKIFADVIEGEPVMWFETDDCSAWGTIDASMTDDQLLEWIRVFAERWGRHYHVKMRERLIEDDVRMAA